MTPDNRMGTGNLNTKCGFARAAVMRKNMKLMTPNPTSTKVTVKMNTCREVIPPPVSQNDPVHHPAHYTKHPSGIECIEVTEHMNFNLGNAVKYIWRCGDKGKPIEDLEKAKWYLEREIKRLMRQAGRIPIERGN